MELNLNELVRHPEFYNVLPEANYSANLQNCFRKSLEEIFKRRFGIDCKAQDYSTASLSTALYFAKNLSREGVKKYLIKREKHNKLVSKPEKEDWAKDLLEDKNKSLSKLYGDASYKTISPSPVQRDLYNKAKEHLKNTSPELLAVYNSFVSHTFFSESKDLLSFTIPQAIGAIVITPKENWTLAHYVEAIVHEATHVELTMKQQMDPLLENPKELTNNPLRKDPRPLNGTFHACLVMLRTCYAISLLPKSPDKEAQLNEYLALLPFALEEIANKAKFTDRGSMFFSNMSLFWEEKFKDFIQ